jgi:hypothetical protein
MCIADSVNWMMLLVSCRQQWVATHSVRQNQELITVVILYFVEDLYVLKLFFYLRSAQLSLREKDCSSESPENCQYLNQNIENKKTILQ